MKIILSPVVSNIKTSPPVVSLSGLNLSIGDVVIDLSMIPEDGQAEWADQSIVRGVITRDQATIVYPYSTDIYDSNQSVEPMDYVLQLLDGEELVCPLKKRTAHGGK